MYMNLNLLIGVLVAGVVGTVVLFTFNNNQNAAVFDENVTESETVNEVTLPSDLSANIPIYPDAVLKNVQDVSDETARNITLTLETPDPVSDVNEWYRGALSQNAWAVTSDRNVGGYILLKGENENVAVFTQAAWREELGVSVITQRVQIK